MQFLDRVKRRALGLLILIMILGLEISAQNVGVGTTGPHPSAALHISDSSRGVLIPRLNTYQRDNISAPAHGLIIFNVETFCLETYDAYAKEWKVISCPGTCTPCDTCQLPQVNNLQSSANSLCEGDTIMITIEGSGGSMVSWNLPVSWQQLSWSDTLQAIVHSSGWVYGSLCNKCGCVTDSLYVNVSNSCP
ncbi:MAG: hypothetical protein GXO48_02390 [Chlorobi bacterium]|nr:hypothetical protein [Chlorobiota bacterium]